MPGPLDGLRQLGPLIVRFGYDGAALVPPEPCEPPVPATIVFDCARIEDEFENERAGEMIGGTATFTAAIAAALAKLLEKNGLQDGGERETVLVEALRAGLTASRRLYLAGLDRKANQGLSYPVDKVL